MIRIVLLTALIVGCVPDRADDWSALQKRGQQCAARAWNTLDAVPDDDQPQPGDTCPDCNGTGRVGDGRVFSKCLACDGTGKVLPKEQSAAVESKLDEFHGDVKQHFRELEATLREAITAKGDVELPQPVQEPPKSHFRIDFYSLPGCISCNNWIKQELPKYRGDVEVCQRRLKPNDRFKAAPAFVVSVVREEKATELGFHDGYMDESEFKSIITQKPKSMPLTRPGCQPATNFRD